MQFKTTQIKIELIKNATFSPVVSLLEIQVLKFEIRISSLKKRKAIRDSKRKKKQLEIQKKQLEIQKGKKKLKKIFSRSNQKEYLFWLFIKERIFFFSWLNPTL